MKFEKQFEPIWFFMLCNLDFYTNIIADVLFVRDLAEVASSGLMTGCLRIDLRQTFRLHQFQETAENRKISETPEKKTVMERHQSGKASI